MRSWESSDFHQTFWFPDRQPLSVNLYETWSFWQASASISMLTMSTSKQQDEEIVSHVEVVYHERLCHEEIAPYKEEVLKNKAEALVTDGQSTVPLEPSTNKRPNGSLAA